MIKHWKLLFCIFLFQLNYAQTDTINLKSLEIKQLNDSYPFNLVFLNDKLYTGFYKDSNNPDEKIYVKIELGEIKEINTYKNNILIKNETYRYGGLSEEIDYFSDGKIQSKGLNFQNKKHGIWKFYKEVGLLEMKKNYQEGKEISLSTLYDINGRKLIPSSFEDRIKYKKYNKIKRDTLQFEKLERKFENCLKVSEGFMSEKYALEDSLRFCKQKYYTKKKSYSGYMYKNTKDTLYFMLEGQFRFFKTFEDGDLLKYATLDVKGNMQGVFYEFYPTGKIRTKGAYLNNKKDGYFYDYYDNGGRKNRFYGYLNDSKAGHWFFYYMPNGLQTKIEIYDSGDIHTVGYEYYDDKRNKHTYFYGPTGELNFRFVEDKNGIPFESEKFLDNKFMDIDVLDEEGRLLKMTPSY